VFGGSGNNRTVTVTPASGQSGTATVTVAVSDAQNQASSSFGLSVTSGSGFVGTQAFTNSTAISVPDKGACAPYPSVINVSDMAGTISDVTVTLRNLTHTYTSDLDILLVSPTGQGVVLASDAGAGAANNVTFTFSDSASSVLPNSPIRSGTFKPANYSDASSGGDNYLIPAPAGPYGSTLSTFKSFSPNGTWSLFVMDDGPGDQGSLAGGWSLSITTSSGTVTAASLAANLIAEPLNIENPLPVQQLTLKISDNKEGVNVEATGIAGQKYLLESSTDLSTWKPQPIVPDENGILHLTEQKEGKRFYRVVQVQ